MSKYRDKLVKLLTEKTGSDATRMVDELYASGAMDDGLARRHVIVNETLKMYANSGLSMRCVQEEIAETHHVSHVAVWKMVTKCKQKAA